MKALKLVYAVVAFAALALILPVLPEAIAAAPALAQPILSALATPEGVSCALLINAANLREITRSFNLLFQGAFDGTPATWNRIAMEVPSTTKEEVYAWLGLNTAFREWIGDRVIQGLKSHDWTIRNKSWENTIGVDRDDISDDKLGVYRPMIQQMGMDAKVHPDQLIYGLLPTGFSALCYDGQYFFDTDHPVHNPATGADVSVSNYGGGSGAAWYLVDASKMVKPFIYQVRAPYKFVSMDSDSDEAVFTKKLFRYGVDARSNVGFGLWQLAYASKQTLDKTAYDASVAAMMAFKGDNGQPLGTRPTILVVGPSNRAAAKALIEVANLAGGGDNPNYKDVEVLVSPWLS